MLEDCVDLTSDPELEVTTATRPVKRAGTLRSMEHFTLAACSAPTVGVAAEVVSLLSDSEEEAKSPLQPASSLAGTTVPVTIH